MAELLDASPPDASIREDGPKMSLLTERERLFVLHRMQQPNATIWESAGAAGYAGDMKALSVAAHRLMHRKRVQEAIAECLSDRFRELGPLAMASTALIAGNPSHKQCLAACKMIFDALEITPSKKVDVTHHHEFTFQELRSRAIQLLREAPIVEGEILEIEDLREEEPQ